MVRLQGKRLVRAVLLGLLILLVVGGGSGFAVAAADDGKPPAMAFPRPGATATYSATEFHVGETQGHLTISDVRMTWLPETWVADRDFNVRLVHPLMVEMRFPNGSGGEELQVREAYYDAATGEPILTSAEGDFHYVDGGYGCDSGTDCKFRYDEYDGRGGPCAVRNALQQGQDLDRPLRVTGYCDYVDGEDDLVYAYVGRERMANHDAFHFRDPARHEFEAWFAPDEAFPVRFTSTLSDEVYYGFLGHERMYDLRLTASTPGDGEYTRPAQPAVVAGPGPLRVLDRQGLGFDFTGFPGAFTFQQAYDAAAQDTSGDGLATFLASHPGAYVAESYQQSATDGYGPHEAWFFIVTDGSAWKAERVEYGPQHVKDATGMGLSFYVPGPAPYGIAVMAWDLDEEGRDARDGGHYYPAADALPAQLPKPADVLQRYHFAQGDAQLDAHYFGWSFLCESRACLSTDTWIGAGYQHAAYNGDGPVPTVPGLLEPGFSDDLGLLSVAANGTPHMRRAFTADRPTYAPLLAGPDGAERGFQLAPQTMNRAAPAGWELPAPVAVAGLSFLALLASALYYFWPALKGAAGQAGVGLFSRIEQGDVLDHPTRRLVHDAITAEPGIHFQALVRKTGLGRGNLDHHLRKLIAAGLVIVRKAPGYTCFFVQGAVDRRLADAAPTLRSDGSRMILAAVHGRPGGTSRDIAAALGIAPSTVSYHLKRLQAAGLVVPGVRAGVHLTPLGRQALDGSDPAQAPAAAA